MPRVADLQFFGPGRVRCACDCARKVPKQLSDVLESKTRLVGEVARPFGHTHVQVESVAMVTGLDGTGEDPAPSPQRTALLHELQTIGVQNPNQLLASPSTALVLVRGFLPPGVQKGDKFDLEVQVPSRSETTSLRGGWLMETRLTEMAVLGGPDSRRPSLGHWRRPGAGRSLGQRREGPCAAGARTRAGRRHRTQVARHGPVHRSRGQVGPVGRSNRPGDQSPFSHVLPRHQAGRGQSHEPTSESI